MESIMQGDAYDIPVCINSGEGIITPATAASVEMTIGSITKKYPGEIYFADQWYFPLSQQESFGLAPGLHQVQVRVKFVSGEIVGADCGCMIVNASESKEEI